MKYLFNWEDSQSKNGKNPRPQTYIVRNTCNTITHLLVVLVFVMILTPYILSDSGKSFFEVGSLRILFLTIGVTISVYKGDDIRKTIF